LGADDEGDDHSPGMEHTTQDEDASSTEQRRVGGGVNRAPAAAAAAAMDERVEARQRRYLEKVYTALRGERSADPAARAAQQPEWAGMPSERPTQKPQRGVVQAPSHVRRAPAPPVRQPEAFWVPFHDRVRQGYA
jgi:hypothetical protein